MVHEAGSETENDKSASCEELEEDAVLLLTQDNIVSRAVPTMDHEEDHKNIK